MRLISIRIHSHGPPRRRLNIKNHLMSLFQMAGDYPPTRRCVRLSLFLPVYAKPWVFMLTLIGRAKRSKRKVQGLEITHEVADGYVYI